MPNVASFAVLEQRVKKYESDYSIETPSIAFSWVALETILNLNVDEIDDALVDEAMDGGIDAIHISEMHVHVFTFNYATTFENTSRSFPQNKLDSLIVTAQKIYSKQLTAQDVNPALWEKVREIWSLFTKGIPTLHFYICSNKEKPNRTSIRRFEESLKPFHFVDFRYFDLEDIVSIILKRRYPAVNGNVNFIGREYYTKANGPLKATVASITATDLIQLITDPDDPNKINECIFNDNVRVDLGLSNRVNRGIFESALSDENFEFWYLNNGITFVCDGCSYIPGGVNPRVELRNVQIVNGGQTARTLFHAYSEDPRKLGNVDVLIRIIETIDRSISEKISETANRQTPVRTRDLHANDWIQKKLEDEFLMLGYYYERKKNQFSDRSPELRLDSEAVGQVALAYYLDMPSEAKNSKSMVFDQKYDDIFDEKWVTAPKLLLPMRLYEPIELQKRQIQARKRKKIPVPDREAFISLATFHILNGIKLIAESEDLILEDEAQAAKAQEKATALIWEVVEQQMKERDELYTHDRFFKERGTNKLIRNHILMSYYKHQSQSP
jgi:hypothetical protein